jgi:hypothetical protein
MGRDPSGPTELECPRCGRIVSTIPCGNPARRLYDNLEGHYRRSHPGVGPRDRMLAAETALASVQAR